MECDIRRRTETVTEVNSECEEDCLLRCTDCDICIHSYECTCRDYLVLANICKHIHLTVRTKKHKTVTKGRGMIDTNKNYSEVNDVIDNMETDSSYTDLAQLRHQAREKIQTLITLIDHCTDRVILKRIDTQLTTTIGLTKCYSQHAQPELTLVQQHPPNKAVTPQRPFFSTRKQ